MNNGSHDHVKRVTRKNKPTENYYLMLQLPAFSSASIPDATGSCLGAYNEVCYLPTPDTRKTVFAISWWL